MSPNCPNRKGLVPRAVVLLLAGFWLGVATSAKEKAGGQAQDASPAPRSAAAGPLEAHQVPSSGIPDSRTVLPAPEVEMDVVTILAGFAKQERPYVQQVVHTAKDLGLLNQQCARKAAAYAQKGLPKASSAQELDLSDVSNFNQGYLKYFDPLRLYLKLSYRRLYDLTPPARFEKAHKYWLAYLAYALENLDHQRFEGKDSDNPPRHSPVEVAQYRAWAYRLFKENGMDLTPYMVR